MDTKKRPHSLSTHHLIGCKDSAKTLFYQTFRRKKPSSGFLALRVSNFFDFHCPLGLKVPGWKPSVYQEQPFFSFLLKTRSVSLRSAGLPGRSKIKAPFWTPLFLLLDGSLVNIPGSPAYGQHSGGRTRADPCS